MKLKRKANGGAKAAPKRASPDRTPRNSMHADTHAHPDTSTHGVAGTCAHPPPGADEIISLVDVPDFVEHPREEMLLHNSAVVKGRIDTKINKRQQQKVKQLTTEQVVQKLGLPLKQQTITINDGCRTQFRAAKAHNHNVYAHADNLDGSELAHDSAWVQSNNFKAVECAIESFQLLTSYMRKEGVPAGNPFYKYISKSTTTKVATTTGEHVHINSFLQVRDLKVSLRELQMVLDRLLGFARIPHGKDYSAC